MSAMYIDKEEFIEIVNGKFTKYSCTECQGKGFHWVDDMGNVQVTNHEDYSEEACEDCQGFGFNVQTKYGLV